MTDHPFDQALHLTPIAPGVYAGATSVAYANMIGPFGGMTAATAMQAVLQHPELLGQPVSLTVNYAGALAAGAFTLSATPRRTNRSTQHWLIELTQPNATGLDEVQLTATAVTAIRRATWSSDECAMPAMPAPQSLPASPPIAGLEWIQRYDMRFSTGRLPSRWDGGGDGSVSLLWMRDAPPRALDFCSLTAMADIFFPRIFLRRARPVPAGTVSMTVYFHADAAQLTQSGTGYLLGQASAQAFRNGFFDQAAQLWNDAGQLLATTHQIVYYKE